MTSAVKITSSRPIRLGRELQWPIDRLCYTNAVEVSDDQVTGSARAADSRTTRAKVDLVFLYNEVGRFHAASEGHAINRIVGHDHRPDREYVVAKDLIDVMLSAGHSQVTVQAVRHGVGPIPILGRC